MFYVVTKKESTKGMKWLVGVCFLSIFPIIGVAQENKVGATDTSTGAEELIRLESTFVGDKEQPSVSYFIRWKGTDSPDGLRWNIQRKNDDTLGLVDRDIMLRSMNIYNEMQLEK